MSFAIRRATPTDAEELARTHLDSIRTIGARFYPPDAVRTWSRGIAPEIYVRAMAEGEAFFVAEDPEDGSVRILGFSTHRRDGETHATAVYVRGDSTRRGLGTALFQRAEEAARLSGARSIEVSSSLAAVAFYRRMGFGEGAQENHAFADGSTIPSVRMTKSLGL